MRRVNLQFLITNVLLVGLGYYIGRLLPSCERLSDPTNNNDQTDEALNRNVYSAAEMKKVASSFTIISFCGSSQECTALNTIADMYPGVKILVASLNGMEENNAYKHIGKFSTRADALNKLTKLVKSDFFLHLDVHHHLGEVGTAQGVEWLVQAMYDVPSLDVVGGSLHVEGGHPEGQDTLEIPCYRIHHYNYTYSESYEYRESIEGNGHTPTSIVFWRII